MDLAEISESYLLAICDELQLSSRDKIRLLDLRAAGLIEKLRKAIIDLSRIATRPVAISCDGVLLVELAEEGALLV